MKSSVDLPGLAIIVALLLGSELAGVLGALVSVPTAVLVAVLIDEYLVSKEPDAGRLKDSLSYLHQWPSQASIRARASHGRRLSPAAPDFLWRLASCRDANFFPHTAAALAGTASLTAFAQQGGRAARNRIADRVQVRGGAAFRA